MGALLSPRAGGTRTWVCKAMRHILVSDGASGVWSIGSGSCVLDRCSFRLSVSWVRPLDFGGIFYCFYFLPQGPVVDEIAW